MQKVVFALGLLAATFAAHDAPACSCAGPTPAMLSPERGVEDAPLNTRARLEIPSQLDEGVKIIFRAHGTTTNVKTTERKMPYGTVTVLELTPVAALDPSTSYEIGFFDPNKHPSTTILGAFKTGTTSDTTAPKLDKVGAIDAVKPANTYGGGSCAVTGPWVQIDGIQASDPGRNAQEISYAVWLADAAGVIDEKKTPTAMLRHTWGTATLGPASICDPHAFPFPKNGGLMTFGFAAVDLAGNVSAVKRATVNLSAPKTLP